MRRYIKTTSNYIQNYFKQKIEYSQVKSFMNTQRDGTRLCCANPASSATVAMRQYPLRTSELKTVHRTVFLTFLTLLGFKSLTNKKGHLTVSFSLVRETGLEPVRDYHTPLKRARLPIPPLSHIHFTSLTERLILYQSKTGLSTLFLQIFLKIFRVEKLYKNSLPTPYFKTLSSAI